MGCKSTENTEINQIGISDEELKYEAEWATQHIPDTIVPPYDPSKLKKLLEQIEKLYKK